MQTPFAALLGNAANGVCVCFVSSAVCDDVLKKLSLFLSPGKKSEIGKREHEGETKR